VDKLNNKRLILKNYNRFKAALAEKGKSNKLLAVQLEMSETTVSNWCSNHRQPSLPTLFKVAEILKMTPRNLIYKS
jgi:transcriptional regulator with XRE-family HTH domain